MDRLIGMTDFVLDAYENAPYEEYNKVNETFSDKVIAYAKLLKQKLSIEMFVPCKLVEGVWVVLEEINDEYPNNVEYFEEIKEYQEAKERCLFKGFAVKNGIIFTPDNQILIQKSLLEKMTMENLVGLKYELTPTARKQIGL